MYAAVLNQLGQTPCYAPLAKPEVQTAEQQLIRVEAASIKQLDKLKSVAGTTPLITSFLALWVLMGWGG